MKILIVKDYNKLSNEAYKVFENVVKVNDSSTICFATGSTPLGLYDNIIEEYKKGNIDLKNIITFNLDEYVGLKKESNKSYYFFMNEALFSKTNIKKENINFLNGSINDLNAECNRYNELLNKNEIDLLILGIGRNGHIAFNEPYTSFKEEVHVVDLSKETINDNARFFDDVEQVPTKALTMGISNILKAKKILLLVSGESKQDSVYEFLNTKINNALPVSALKLHNDVTVIIDYSASKKLFKCLNE